VRVVPNKYPVLSNEETSRAAEPLEDGRGEPDLFASGDASGPHEVIVHAPEHLDSIRELSAEQFELAISAWQSRVAAHADAAYVHLIVNEGLSAGASLEHTHSQLYSLPFVPVIVARERERFTAHNTRTTGCCLLCDLLAEEVRRRERIVAVNDDAVLIAPYASRMPYELRLVPRKHARSFVDAEPAAAALLRDGLLLLEKALGVAPPLNLWLRTAPKGAEHFHWHIDVVPRLTQLAGLELGAGVAVNVYPPEAAAAELRESKSTSPG
jgi:UDPglucose--hexose-1-phosphate uridylyltransferase